MTLKRVVVTGLGALSPLGNDVKSTWNAAKEGKSGAGPITHFDASAFKTQFACEVKNFDPTSKLDRNEIKRSDPFTQYALYAATEAVEDAGINISDFDSPFDVGVIWGSGQGGIQTLEAEVKDFALNNSIPRFSPFLIPKMLSNMASGLISMKFGFMGMNYAAVSACATGNTAIMDAFNYIRLGKVKAVVTGGSESPIHASSIGGFNAMKALSTRNDAPQQASRPFDTDRDGFIMGEGAAALVLEEYEHAVRRGATIYAELVGAAMTADAYHMTATHPEGEGAYHSMKFAMDEAGVSIKAVDYVNAHATSTPVGDLSEMKALQRHLKDQKNDLQVSGTKSMTGHLLGAAGAIEAIFCIKAITDSVIPPTINTENVDPEIPENINLVLKTAMEKPVRYALSNTFGFGGHNSTVLFRRMER